MQRMPSTKPRAGGRDRAPARHQRGRQQDAQQQRRDRGRAPTAPTVLASPLSSRRAFAPDDARSRWIMPASRRRRWRALDPALQRHQREHDRHVERERDEERRQRLVGLGADAHRGARDVDDADHRQHRRDLDQQRHLVDQAGQARARDLRQHDAPEALPGAHADRLRRLDLVLRESHQRGAPDLAVEGRGVHHQREDRRRDRARSARRHCGSAKNTSSSRVTSGVARSMLT